MQSFSFFVVIAIISTCALAKPHLNRLQFDSIPKDRLAKLEETDFDRILNAAVVSWAQMHLTVLASSQKLDALLTGSGHTEAWDHVNDVITKTLAEAEVIYNEALSSADPNADVYEFIALIYVAALSTVDVVYEGKMTVNDLILVEAADVHTEAEVILNEFFIGLESTFQPLYDVIVSIVNPRY